MAFMASNWSPRANLPVASNRYAFERPGICLVTVSNNLVPFPMEDYSTSLPANMEYVDRLRRYI